MDNNKIKIGIIGYSSSTGLGYQMYDFARYIKPSKVLICDLSELNGMEVDHSKYSDFNTRIAMGIPTDEDCEWLVNGMDIVFIGETPLNYHLFKYARQKGVKTVQQLNPEFWDFWKHPYLPKPDVLGCPSPWMMKEIERTGIANTVLWSVPVDTSKMQYREFDQVRTLVHILGRPAAEDRNGTIAFLNAAKYFGFKYKYKIYMQPPKDVRAFKHFQPVQRLMNAIKEELKDSLEIITDTPNNADMYKSGEILVLPRRYGGLCLPMWEALSSGMPVIMTNTSPNNEILPHEWLCECSDKGSFIAKTEVTLYEANHESLVKTISRVADNIKEYNKIARDLADSMSWEVQAPIYIERFKQLCLE